MKVNSAAHNRLTLKRLRALLAEPLKPEFKYTEEWMSAVREYEPLVNEGIAAIRVHNCLDSDDGHDPR